MSVHHRNSYSTILKQRQIVKVIAKHSQFRQVQTTAPTKIARSCQFADNGADKNIITWLMRVRKTGAVPAVQPGRVLFEVGGVDEETAREALRLAAHKLPVKCKFVRRGEEE